MFSLAPAVLMEHMTNTSLLVTTTLPQAATFTRLLADTLHRSAPLPTPVRVSRCAIV